MIYAEKNTPPGLGGGIQSKLWLAVPLVLAAAALAFYVQQQAACNGVANATTCVWKLSGGVYVCVNQVTQQPCPAGSCPPR